jgi:hypothetical protein
MMREIFLPFQVDAAKWSTELPAPLVWALWDLVILVGTGALR